MATYSSVYQIKEIFAGKETILPSKYSSRREAWEAKKELVKSHLDGEGNGLVYPDYEIVTLPIIRAAV